MDFATLATFDSLAFDWGIDGPQLATDDGLRTAVVISLFTDRRAGTGDTLPDASNDRRGWFGDNFADVEGDRIGSLLWLLAREKQTPAVLQRARSYARDALRWLVEDGVAKEVDVQAEWLRMGVLGIDVQIHRADSTRARYRFEKFWGDSNGV